MARKLVLCLRKWTNKNETKQLMKVYRLDLFSFLRILDVLASQRMFLGSRFPSDICKRCRVHLLLNLRTIPRWRNVNELLMRNSSRINRKFVSCGRERIAYSTYQSPIARYTESLEAGGLPLEECAKRAYLWNLDLQPVDGVRGARLGAHAPAPAPPPPPASPPAPRRRRRVDVTAPAAAALATAALALAHAHARARIHPPTAARPRPRRVVLRCRLVVRRAALCAKGGRVLFDARLLDPLAITRALLEQLCRGR